MTKNVKKFTKMDINLTEIYSSQDWEVKYRDTCTVNSASINLYSH